MFTIDQISRAHAKVRTGADFPAYVKEISQLGVRLYATFVSDGHTVYYGEGSYSISTLPKYAHKRIADSPAVERFKKALKEHQQGNSDYPTFCDQSAAFGVEKWMVDMQQMTCTYYDKAGNEMLQENIPQP